MKEQVFTDNNIKSLTNMKATAKSQSQLSHERASIHR